MSITDQRYLSNAQPGNEGEATFVAVYEGMPMGGWAEEDGLEEFREIVLSLLEDFYSREHEDLVRRMERDRQQALSRVAFGELDDGTIGFPEIVDLPDETDLEYQRHVVDPALLVIERVHQPAFRR